MSEQTAKTTTGRPPGHYLLHSIVLFGVFVALFQLVQPGLAVLLSVLAGAAYLVWSLGASLVRNRGADSPPVRVLALLTGFVLAVPLLALGLGGLLLVGWLKLAYSDDVLWLLPDMVWMAPAALILVPLLFLVLTPVIAGTGGGIPSRFLAGVRERGFGHFHQSWLGGTALVLGLACLILSVFLTWAMQELASARGVGGDIGEVISIWRLATEFPYLPISLLAAAVMLSVSRVSAVGKKRVAALARAYTHGETAGPALDVRARAVLGAAVAGGWAATLFVIVFPLHLGVVVALTSMVGIDSLTESAIAVESLIAERREAGVPVAEIATELNRVGAWSPDAPKEGLATLVEDAEYVFSDRCGVRMAAGVASLLELAGSGQFPREQALSEVKYCIAVRCASPVVWEAPPALLLYSSHASQATYWQETIYLDLFAEGRAAAPGGYCTADGALADSFQG